MGQAGMTSAYSFPAPHLLSDEKKMALTLHIGTLQVGNRDLELRAQCSAVRHECTALRVPVCTHGLPFVRPCTHVYSPCTIYDLACVHGTLYN